MMLTPTQKYAPTAAHEVIHDIIPIELAIQETSFNMYYGSKLSKFAEWTNKKAKKIKA